MSTFTEIASQLDVAVAAIPAVREVYAADAAVPRVLRRLVDSERARVDVREKAITVAIGAESDTDCVGVARDVAATVRAITRSEGLAASTVRVRVSRLISPSASGDHGKRG